MFAEPKQIVQNTKGQFTQSESEKDQRQSEEIKKKKFKHQRKFSLSRSLSLGVNRPLHSTHVEIHTVSGTYIHGHIPSTVTQTHIHRLIPEVLARRPLGFP